MTREAERLPVQDLSTWLVLAPGIGLVLMALSSSSNRGLGSHNLRRCGPAGIGALSIAIGLRDVAFGLYILGLALFSSRRAVGLVLV